MTDFIPIAEYARLHNKSRHMVYSLLRRNKFKYDDIKIIEEKVKHYRIHKNAEIIRVFKKKK